MIKRKISPAAPLVSRKFFREVQNIPATGVKPIAVVTQGGARAIFKADGGDIEIAQNQQHFAVAAQVVVGKSKRGHD
jgi:hypothetical protein